MKIKAYGNQLKITRGKELLLECNSFEFGFFFMIQISTDAFIT